MSQPAVQRVVKTAASLDLADYTRVECAAGEAPSGSNSLGSQAVGFRAQSTNSSAGTIQLCIAYPSGATSGLGVIEVWNGTVTSTARRNIHGNGSGLYVCDVVWAKSGTKYVDLSGVGDDINKDAVVYVNMTDMGGLGDTTLEWFTTRNA